MTVPGSYVGIYGGGTLSDEIIATADSTPGTVQARGKPFAIYVNTNGAAANSLGFNLAYHQLPCGDGVN